MTASASPMLLLVDYSIHRAVVTGKEQRRRTTDPGPGLVSRTSHNSSRRAPPLRRATYGGYRRSMSLILEPQEEAEDEDCSDNADDDETLMDSSSRISFRMKRRGSTGATEFPIVTSHGMGDNGVPTSAEKFQKSLTDLFQEGDEEDTFFGDDDDDDKAKDLLDISNTEQTEGETITSRTAEDDMLGRATDDSLRVGFVDTRKFRRGSLGEIVSSTADDEDNAEEEAVLLASRGDETKEAKGQVYVDTSKFSRGRQQLPTLMNSSTTNQQASEHSSSSDEPSRSETTTSSSEPSRSETTTSSSEEPSSSSETTPTASAPPRDVPPLKSNSAHLLRPTLWRRLSQTKMADGSAMDASTAAAVIDHTRRRMNRLSSLRKMQDGSINDSTSNHNNITLGSTRRKSFGRSISMKSAISEASDTTDSLLTRSSSMKSFKTMITNTSDNMSASEHRRQNERMKRVHSLRNVMGDLTLSSESSHHREGSRSPPRSRRNHEFVAKPRPLHPKRNFSMMNFAGDQGSGPRLDRRASLLNSKRVSSMGNLTRDLMDDKSSRDHYYKGCSMRNLMSDSSRTLGNLLKEASERQSLNDSKQLNNESVSRLNLMWQNSTRSLMQECSEQAVNVDRMNMMRQNSNRNLLTSRRLMKDLSEQAMGTSTRRNNLLSKQESSKSLSKDQSAAARRQNRRLLNRKSVSMRNLTDGSAYESSQRRRLAATNAPRGLVGLEVEVAGLDKRRLARSQGDLKALQQQLSQGSSEKKSNASKDETLDRRLGLLVGRTISFRSNSSRNLCRTGSSRNLSGSPVQSFTTKTARAS